MPKRDFAEIASAAKPRRWHLFLHSETPTGVPMRGVDYTEDGVLLEVWSVFDFISLFSGKKISSYYGRDMFSALNKRFHNALADIAVQASIDGETMPCMTVHELKWLLFLIPNEDYRCATRMYNTFVNMEYDRKVNDMKYRLPPAGKGERFKLFLFRRKHDEEPIRGMLHEGDLYWSVYDFICVAADKKVDSNYGRVACKRINERYQGKVEERSVRIPINKRGQHTLAMRTFELRRFLFGVEHSDFERAKTAHKVLTRILMAGFDDEAILVDDN